MVYTPWLFNYRFEQSLGRLQKQSLWSTSVSDTRSRSSGIELGSWKQFDPLNGYDFYSNCSLFDVLEKFRLDCGKGDTKVAPIFRFHSISENLGSQTFACNSPNFTADSRRETNPIKLPDFEVQNYVRNARFRLDVHYPWFLGVEGRGPKINRSRSMTLKYQPISVIY